MSHVFGARPKRDSIRRDMTTETTLTPGHDPAGARRGADLGSTTSADVPIAAAKREGRRIAVTSHTATTFLDPVDKSTFIVHAVASKQVANRRWSAASSFDPGRIFRFGPRFIYPSLPPSAKTASAP
jgi:hypothetical protein